MQKTRRLALAALIAALGSTIIILGSMLQVLDLTGCSLENILYYPDREIPVLALLEDGNAVLITGFNERNVVLMDPQTGQVSRMGLNDASAWFEENGNMFVSYVEMQ